MAVCKKPAGAKPTLKGKALKMQTLVARVQSQAGGASDTPNGEDAPVAESKAGHKLGCSKRRKSVGGCTQCRNPAHRPWAKAKCTAKVKNTNVKNTKNAKKTEGHK